MPYRFIAKDSFVYRLLLCFGVGGGTLLGLSPFSFFSAGMIAAVSCMFLFFSLNQEPFWKASLWILILSQILNCVAFYWIPGAVSGIAGTGPIVSVLFFLLYGLVSHLKFFPFYALFRFSKVESVSQPSVLLVFPAAGAVADMITIQIFPWYWGNLISGSIVFEQFASICGVYGLSFLLLFISSVFIMFLSHFKRKKSEEFRIAVVAAIGIASVYFYGLYRIGYADRSSNEGKPKDLSVLMIQPDTSPGTKDLKADSNFLSVTMSKVFSLALRGSITSENPPSLIVIPESAIPFHGTIDSEENRKEHIYSSTMEGIVLFLSKHTGADIIFNELNMEGGKLRNQVSLFKSADGSFERYDKRKLLAFGEYLPMENELPFLRSIFKETSRYVPGEIPKLLIGNKIRNTKPILPPSEKEISRLNEPEIHKAEFFSRDKRSDKIINLEYSYSIMPLLCYEAMFTELVLDYFRTGEQPEILINLTNDSWFDSELEAYQHSGAVRLRAIETGLPLIRSTVSGISEVWDARGIPLIVPIGFHETGTRTFSIRPGSAEPTIYTELGNSLLWVCCVSILIFRFILVLISVRKSRC
ncbi:apolipoprotein N-acyltransferase [Leptospira alstonii]|uniref:Apolipoprotein N-acyltransferase n=2 Tax=Leptospira alstonii TaxID=28452 RepID=M6CUM9_9LEPT|nr:nitrilase-related carbon-nitrogen hydrolase [Leptospira alstonii]EMJ95419.1 apolipoprotein N-acyltransferase [Leptospira alstonii serovar Sichuan str. 79601]EQA80114.1 apolipoprotein N-acyltransferase [Leptospira alstonii serovar Pingchang str. 80-412]